MTRPLSRRRFLTVAAAAAGCSLAGSLTAHASDVPRIFVTRGSALGATATLALLHDDPKTADAAARLCLAEIERLERIFSLYRPDSALVALNRQGRLDEPPAELVELLADSQHFGLRSGGAFDVTVQPLWQLYAGHFAQDRADPAGPGKAAIAAARALVDFRRISIGTRRIAYGALGMAVTLNGIAQGYVTDRIAALLVDLGFHDVMIDAGEIRALGAPPEKPGWPVGLRDPLRPDATFDTLALSGKAVASSGGYGCQFEASGRHHHIFDPRTGESASVCRGVSVVAAKATLADALSTAFSVMSLEAAAELARAIGNLRVIFTLADGNRHVIEA